MFSPPVVSPAANTCDKVGVEDDPLLAEVTCPFASTVTVARLYVPAVTPELACAIVTAVSYTHLTLPTKA